MAGRRRQAKRRDANGSKKKAIKKSSVQQIEERASNSLSPKTVLIHDVIAGWVFVH